MKKLFAAVLALAMTASLAACAGGNSSSSQAASTSSEAQQSSSAASDSTASQAEPAAVLTHEEYMAAELDTQVTVETYVQAKQSWWEDKATIYAQSEDGAYFIYDAACSEELYEQLTPGTCIRVTGYKGEWSGEVEIMEGTELLGTEELIDHQNELVQFKGLTVEAAGQDDAGNDVAFLYNWDGSGTEGDDLYFNVSYNGETYTFTVESYLCDSSSEVYNAVKNLEIGQTVDLEGFLYWYEGVNPHITSVTVVG